MPFLNTSSLQELFYTQAGPVQTSSIALWSVGRSKEVKKITIQGRLGLRPVAIPKKTKNTGLKKSEVSNQENIRGSSVKIPPLLL